MADQHAESRARPLGFWTCWSLTVGVMIGSGIFTLPAVLAQYGLLSFGGWMLTGAGSILIALTLGRLAARTRRTGGPYAYAHDAFGDLPGFLVGWGYWASYWTAVPAVAIAFVGYLGVFIPALNENPTAQALTALGVIWTLTLVAIRGVREAGAVQIGMTFLKLIPLIAIIALGIVAGTPENLPEVNPSGGSPITVLAVCALLTMWAFAGLEAGCTPAGSVKDAERTIPRAVVIGTLTVTVVYLAATAAVMMLVPAEILQNSTSPFAEAARGFGSWGPGLIAVGAMLATAGSLNGNIFISGQLPMAIAIDRLAPRIFAHTNKRGAPYVSLILASTLSSVLLMMSFSRGLLGAFELLIKMSTLVTLLPLLVSAIAELKHSWRTAGAWLAVILLAALFALFAIFGSAIDQGQWNPEILGWGVVLLAAGVPLYYLGRQNRAAAAV